MNAMAPANLALLLVFIPAILTAVGVDRNLIVSVDLATGDRTLVGEIDDDSFPLPRAPSLRVGRSLALADGVAYLVDGDADVVFAFDLATGTRTVLSAASDGPGILDPSPDAVVAGGVLLTPGDDGALVSVDLDSGARALVALGDGVAPKVEGLTVGPDGALWTHRRTLNNRVELWRTDLLSGDDQAVSDLSTTGPVPVNLSVPRIAPDGAYVLSSQSGRGTLLATDTATGVRLIVAK